MRVHEITYESTANGPGVRNVLHLQGCGIHCPGCFNPGTWDRRGGLSMSVARCAELLLRRSPGGVTISGGEPLDQPEELFDLLRLIRSGPTAPDSVWVYSGYTADELRERGLLPQLRALVDVLIAGPFLQSDACDEVEARGSTNQEVLHFSERGLAEYKTYQPPSVEILVDTEATTRITGFPTKRLRRELARNL